MMSQLITVIIPCYNQGTFLKATLDSVLSQTHTNWECLLVNDGSTDDTKVIAQVYSKKDDRFIYLEKPNSGVGDTRNLGLETSKGAFIQFLDADDIIAPSKLAAGLEIFNEKREIDIVYSNFKMFDVSVADASPPYCKFSVNSFTFDQVLYHWNDSFSIPIHCGLFRKKMFDSVRFPEHLTAQEDWIVWVQFFKNGCIPHFMDEPLAYYRRNPNSRMNSGNMIDDQMKAILFLKSVITLGQYDLLIEVILRRNYTRIASLQQENITLKEMSLVKLTRVFNKIARRLKLIK